uniref:Uncharacterized protein n=1 Tax=Steinernema glaseri TaxID=37863 RepID=A0A1I7YRI1_9BILA
MQVRSQKARIPIRMPEPGSRAPAAKALTALGLQLLGADGGDDDVQEKIVDSKIDSTVFWTEVYGNCDIRQKRSGMLKSKDLQQQYQVWTKRFSENQCLCPKIHDLRQSVEVTEGAYERPFVDYTIFWITHA